MVDYDIIRVLKNHIGYKSWDEVSMTEREYCFKNYSPQSGLPMWNTVEEKYVWVKFSWSEYFYILWLVTEGDTGKFDASKYSVCDSFILLFVNNIEWIDASKYSVCEYFLLLFVNQVEWFLSEGSLNFMLNNWL